MYSLSGTLCITQGPTGKNNHRDVCVCVCVCVYEERELKELAHMIMGAGKCEIQRPAG